MDSNDIIFRLNTENVSKVNELWWWTLKEGKVQRDQFSLMWSLWKVPTVKTGFVLSENENAWHNDGRFNCVDHKPHKRVLDKSLWEKLRDRYVRMFYSSGGWEIYYTQWFDKLIKTGCPHLMMHLWTAWIAVRYDSKLLLSKAWNRIKREKINISKS